MGPIRWPIPPPGFRSQPTRTQQWCSPAASGRLGLPILTESPTSTERQDFSAARSVAYSSTLTAGITREPLYIRRTPRRSPPMYLPDMARCRETGYTAPSMVKRLNGAPLPQGCLLSRCIPRSCRALIFVRYLSSLDTARGICSRGCACSWWKVFRRKAAGRSSSRPVRVLAAEKTPPFTAASASRSWQRKVFPFLVREAIPLSS